jgi:hypothetical protein
MVLMSAAKAMRDNFKPTNGWRLSFICSATLRIGGLSPEITGRIILKLV